MAHVQVEQRVGVVQRRVVHTCKQIEDDTTDSHTLRTTTSFDVAVCRVTIFSW